MPDQSRSLPFRPSLRYLKLEAKRRLAAGEFPTLSDAQLAVAREHGQRSWAALRQVIDDKFQQESHALAQLKWVITRFRDADRPGWSAPAEEELRQHFDERFLAAIPAGSLVASIAGEAAALRQELVVIDQAPIFVRAQTGGLEVFASVDADPPYLLTGLRGDSLGGRIADSRTAAPPPARTLGEVPAWAAETAESAFGELGLAGLVLAGSGPGGPAWVTTKGWADLDRAEVLETGHRFPASGISALVTATAVLRLVADGRVGLGTPANDYLRTVRLADDTITVRELLSHTGGVDSPAVGAMLADRVPDLVAVTGPVIACNGPRGAVQPSNGGCAALGQLIADVTTSAYAEAVTSLVLEPLGMTGTSFPARGTDVGPRAITCYNVTPDGKFEPLPAQVCTVPAAGGMWAAAADVVRLAATWSSLLPAALAREALAPHSGPDPDGGRAALGWFISPRGDIAINGGALAGSAASLLVRIRDNQVQVIMTSRNVAIDRINDRVLRCWGNQAHQKGARP
jgi:CubicO group peptidase (beta-lactamase class C family)